MTRLQFRNKYAAVHVCLTQQGSESKPNQINASLQNLGPPIIQAHSVQPSITTMASLTPEQLTRRRAPATWDTIAVVTHN